jgi:UDP:flavonoid glycosyltransferase YjiC (YdhE family)
VRALFGAPGGVGHLHPLLALATALRDRGHDVRFAVAADHCAAIERAGLAAVAAGLTSRERVARVMALPATGTRRQRGREHADVGFPYGFGAIAMPAMVEDLRPVAASFRPDVIVHDAAELASALVAAELGVRHVTHSFGTTVPTQRLAKAGELSAHLWEQSGLEQPPYAALFSDVYVDIRPPSLPGHPPAGTLVLAERPTVTDAVGGELPGSVRAAPGDPLVYVTLGTVFSSESVLRVVVDALAQLPLRVLVTVGPAGDPAALGDVPANIHVERYVPQGQLLPFCAMVISHAGSGTFLGALAHGLPQLCLPQAADQFLNADAGAEMGAALMLEPDLLSADAVRSAVEQLLHSTSYKEAAERIAAEMAAMPSADDVAGELEEIVG